MQNYLSMRRNLIGMKWPISCRSFVNGNSVHIVMGLKVRQRHEYTNIALRGANGNIQQTHRRYNADEYAGDAAHGHLRGVWLWQRAGEPVIPVHHARGCARKAAQCLWHTRLCHDGDSAYLG